MARGILTPDDKLKEMLAKLKPILQTGVSLYRAVCFYNAENEFDYIPYTTIRDYRRKSAFVRKKIKAWQDYPKMLARVTINKYMAKDPRLALEYLKRREPKEFGDRQEITQTTNLTGKLGVEIDTSKLTLEQKIQYQQLLQSILKTQTQNDDRAD